MRHLLEIDTVFTSWKHSAPTSIRSRAVKSILSPTLISLTLNSQFVTPIEAGSVFLLLPHLQRLQCITIYKSQQGEEHTSHNELHELNTTPAPNTQRMQRRTTTHSEVTLLPAQRALPNRDGLNVGMILTPELTHVGEGEGCAAEGGEVREGGEIEFSAALHSGVHIDLLHRVRETILIGGVREGIGGGENELFQRGGVGFTLLYCDGVNPSKGLGNVNLEVVRDVYNSIPSLFLTLQCNHVHGIELSSPTSTNVTKRRQIDHGKSVGECVGLLSREQGGFIVITFQSIPIESEIGEGRKI